MLESASLPDGMVHPVAEIEKFAAWILGMLVAVAVFFQVHMSLPGGRINLNLADPIAVLALAVVSLHVLLAKQLPGWRIGQFNLALGIISLQLLLGFINGWLEIGVTQWALGGRLLGWFVLLGYLSAGYLIVAKFGAHGLRRFAETLIATAVVVVILQAILRLLGQWGVSAGVQLTPNFEGYAGNRNAFAFQLLAVMALLLGYSQVYARYGAVSKDPGRPRVFSLLFGILLAGQVWSYSRTGMFVVVAVLLFAWVGRLADRRMIVWGVIFATILWTSIWLAAQKIFILSVFSGNIFAQGFSVESLPVQNVFAADASPQEHWTTLVRGLELWRQSPVLGIGLGVFIAKSPMWLGHAQVIHSTPVWILAELGLVGAGVFGWTFFLLGRHAVRFDKVLPSRRILLLLLTAFIMFGFVHEIFYQRIFWLVLGAVLARPFALSLHP